MLKLETLFSVFLGACLVMYFYFFLFLPQNWSLNDDYGQIKDWALDPKLNPWTAGLNFFRGRLNEGRFLPFDSFLRLIRYKFLPVEPVFYRGGQFLLLAIALFAITLFVKKVGFSRFQVIFTVFLILTNLSIKEWIVLTSAAETLAVPFFCLALAAYVYNCKILGVLFFACAFLSKESFLVLGGAILALEYFDFKKTRKISWLPLLALALSSSVFVLTISKLPRVYTGGSHFSILSLKNIFQSLIIPPLKTYGLAILFSIIVLIQRKSSLMDQSSRKILWVSLSIVIPFSIFLSLWGPFDSWSYLHLIIPWGWAMILALPLREDVTLNRTSYALAAILVFVTMVMTMRGSFNRWQSLREATVAADMACEDFNRTPNLKVFSNCEEGSNQLQNYLLLYGKNCVHPPVITYVAHGLPAQTKAPYEILFGRKWCNTDGSEFEKLPVTYRYHMNIWSVYKFMSDQLDLESGQK